MLFHGLVQFSLERFISLEKRLQGVIVVELPEDALQFTKRVDVALEAGAVDRTEQFQRITELFGGDAKPMQLFGGSLPVRSFASSFEILLSNLGERRSRAFCRRA